MKNTIEYIILKAFQIFALFYFPIRMYWMCEQPFSFEYMIWMGIDAAVFMSFLQDFKHSTLEKRLHREL